MAYELFAVNQARKSVVRRVRSVRITAKTERAIAAHIFRLLVVQTETD